MYVMYISMSMYIYKYLQIYLFVTGIACTAFMLTHAYT